MSILNHPPNPHIPYEHSEYGQKLIQHINQRPEMDNISNKELADQIQALRSDMESRYRENQMRDGWYNADNTDTKVRGGCRKDFNKFANEGRMIANAKQLEIETQSKNTNNDKDTVGDAVFIFFIAGGFVGWVFLIKEIFS
jgi:hypothetical protein